MVARPLVVAVVPIAPSMRGNGLAMRAARLVVGLAGDHDVDVIVVPVAGVLDPALALAPPAAGPGRGTVRARVIPLPDAGEQRAHLRAELAHARWRERLRRLLPAPAGMPVVSPALAADVERGQAGGRAPTQVWALRAGVAPVGRELASRWGVPLAVDLDDDDVGFLERAGAPVEAAAVGRLIAEDVGPAALVAAAGPTAAAAISARLGRDVAIIPNGVRIPADPRPAGAPVPGEAAKLLFVANFTYGPNAEGAAWLASEVLASPRLEHPVQVRLVGPGARALAVAAPAGSSHRVVPVGPVADLDGEYRGAHLVVAPVRDGGGTSTKVPEAGAHRRAVVTTTAASRDLAMRDREHVRVADAPDGFAAAIDDLLGDPAAADRLARAARAHVVAVHSDEHAQRVVADLARALQPLDGRAGRSPTRERP